MGIPTSVRRAVLAVSALTSATLGVGVGGSMAPQNAGADVSQTPCTPNSNNYDNSGEPQYSCYYTYAEVDDRQIAVAVSLPVGYAAVSKYPTLFEMDGYDGGAGPLDPNAWGNNYVMVHASVAGTGCSSGQFDLFSWNDAEDGAAIVDNWIPSQSWSNGRVGLIGHSYPGLTGFMTAERIGYDVAQGDTARFAGATQHLYASALSGLVDDLYRGIVYMGGVPDTGFPLLWAGFDRSYSELSGNADPTGQLGNDRYESDTGSGDLTCLENVALRPASNGLGLDTAGDNPIVNGLVSEQDGPWWAAHSLNTYLGYLGVPTHIDQQYQDEQTGPRGGALLFEELARQKPDLPKRIVFTNGRHDSAGHVYHHDEVNWLDCYVRFDPTACTAIGQTPPSGLTQPVTGGWVSGGTSTVSAWSTSSPCPGYSVVLYFETTGTSVNPPLCAAGFPFPDSDWQRYYLNADGTMTRAQGATGYRSYVSTSAGPDDYVGPTETPADPISDGVYGPALGPVLSSQGPQELTYTLDFGNQNAATTIDGPIMADLYASVSGVDTDFFVQLIDRDMSSGAEQFLQYGLLRGSFIASADPTQANYIAQGPMAGQVYRPYYSYQYNFNGTQTPLLTPGAVDEFQIEVFPLGWVVRPGHKILVTISAPPAWDQLYGWTGAERPPTINTIVSDSAHPSSLLVPLSPIEPSVPSAAPACGEQEGVRCAIPAEDSTSSGLPLAVPPAPLPPAP